MKQNRKGKKRKSETSAESGTRYREERIQRVNKL